MEASAKRVSDSDQASKLRATKEGSSQECVDVWMRWSGKRGEIHF
jgi:hypothetical protein